MSVQLCECEWVRKRDTEVQGGVLLHHACGLPVPCEFGYLNDIEHPATLWVLDYHVCGEHERHAIDNVSTRDS